MKDVDKQIEEVRARHKPAGNDMMTKFKDVAKKRKVGGIVPPVK